LRKEASTRCERRRRNWYYFADHLPLLRFSLHFEHVLALGLIGLWLERTNAARHRILWYFLLAACSLMYSTEEREAAASRRDRSRG